MIGQEFDWQRYGGGGKRERGKWKGPLFVVLLIFALAVAAGIFLS